MSGWPPIEDPRVLEWLGLDHEGWRRALARRASELGGRAFDEEALRHALGYPWQRPTGSYLLREGEVLPVGDLRALTRDRHPLIAFGANGAPTRLRERFAAFDEPADREALVLTGELHDVDVAAAAGPTVLGFVPGALVASPGTAVRAAVLWLTPRQLACITYAELGYRLGRLERARFTMDEAGVAVDHLFAFVSRVGALRLDGGPVGLAAVPARGRSAPAMTQEELLGLLAGLALGPGAGAADLVRRCLADFPGVVERMAELTWPDAIRLPDDHWTPYPVPRR